MVFDLFQKRISITITAKVLNNEQETWIAKLSMTNTVL